MDPNNQSYRNLQLANCALVRFPSIEKITPALISSLDLSYNHFYSFPGKIFQSFTNLKRFKGNNNLVKSLPEEILACKRLMRVEVDNNHVDLVYCRVYQILKGAGVILVSPNLFNILV